jgi:hypothetical protein
MIMRAYTSSTNCLIPRRWRSFYCSDAQILAVTYLLTEWVKIDFR